MKYLNLTDDQIAELVRGGDEKAFGEIYRRHQAHLLKYVVKNQLYICGNSYEPEDIVQDTFVRAQIAIIDGKYKPQESMFPWLMRIAINKFINLYRQNAKREIISLSPCDFLTDESTEQRFIPPEDTKGYELKYAMEYMHKKAKYIPVNLQVIIPFLVDGYKYEEIAKEMSLPLGTVRSKIFHLKKKIRKIMEKDGVGIEALL